MVTITLSQIDKEEEKIRAIQELVSELQEVVRILLNTPVLQDKEGNVKVDLNSIQKTSLLTEYNKRKQALQNAVQSLL